MSIVTNEKKLVENNLKQGDILLFSPCDDWESQMIAKLTNSPVTHAAMMYYDMTTIVEEMPPHAQTNILKDRIEDRTISVMRLNPVNPVMAPVLKRAEGYVAEEVPYSNVNLVFVGLYMLIRKAVPKQHLHGVTKLLQLATVELCKIVNDIKYKGVHPFVCSQFVFNCYYTADEKNFEYALKLKPTALSNSLLDELRGIESGRNMALRHEPLDLKALETTLNEEILKALPHVETEEGLKKFIDELIDDLNAETRSENELLTLDNGTHEAFVKAAHEFLEVLDKAFDLKGEEGQSPLEKVYAFQEYFVTPGDLLKNVENLDKVGELDNEKIKENK